MMMRLDSIVDPSEGRGSIESMLPLDLPGMEIW